MIEEDEIPLNTSNIKHGVLTTAIDSNVLSSSSESSIQQNIAVSTRSGRNVSGGRGSEYVCQCSGNFSSCDKSLLHSMEKLKKCRNCNVYVLITHLSRDWKCGKCTNIVS